MQTQLVTIYTDGACTGNPGIGAYGAILNYHGAIKEISGVALDTTNNRMELSAVIEALRILTRPCNVAVFTDSQYVQKGMSEWIEGWKKKNWKNVKNVDLWQELDSMAQQHQIKWNWVRGHNGDVLNERADELANIAIEEYQKNLDKTHM